MSNSHSFTTYASSIPTLSNLFEGILLVDKSLHKTSFSIIHELRKITGIKTIGHAGTLDPAATGVMIVLLGKKFTRLSNRFMKFDKEYVARVHLGFMTKSYDGEEEKEFVSDRVPSKEELLEILKEFQGEIWQTPPMFSAKKLNGQKLYDLARKGVEVERAPVKIFVKTTLLEYAYPYIDLQIECSKGTYIRSVAHDLGQKLGTGGYLSSLVRTRIGPFLLECCLKQDILRGNKEMIQNHLLKHHESLL